LVIHDPTGIADGSASIYRGELSAPPQFFFKRPLMDLPSAKLFKKHYDTLAADSEFLNSSRSMSPWFYVKDWH
jgi:hypothetical protein